MALITWNDSLSVGVVEIDRQHAKLIAIINDLDGAMRVGKANDVMGEIVDALIIYTATHFRMEEQYFTTFEYRDGENHKKEHAAFIKKVSDFNEEFAKKKETLTAEVMTFLSDWMKNHIMGTDKKCFTLFAEQGMK